MDKKVTIVCITYNQQKYIRDAIESLVTQKTNFNFEIIISDDCSTDNTPTIIKEYAEKYPDIIKPVFREKNIGAIKNFIYSISLVKSEYIALCEGDDYWINPYKLQKQIDFLETNTEYAGCFHPVKVTYENINKRPTIYPDRKDVKGRKFFTLDDLLQKNYIQTNSVVYRWRFREENILDYFPENIIPGDWYLHLLQAQNGNIAFLPDVMAVYRRNSQGIWYDSLTNIENLHLKYGIKEINFYYNVYKNITNSSRSYFEKYLLPVSGNILRVYFENQKFNEIMELKNTYTDLFGQILEFNNSNKSGKKKLADQCSKYKKLFNLFFILTIILAVLNVVQLVCYELSRFLKY